MGKSKKPSIVDDYFERRPLYYKLAADGQTPVPCGRDEWKFGTPVAQEHLTIHDVTIYLSTVFLGMDHGYSFETDASGQYHPVLWETMAFYEDGPSTTQTAAGIQQELKVRHSMGESVVQWRWRSHEEATAGHARIYAALQLSLEEGHVEFDALRERVDWYLNDGSEGISLQ